MPPESFQESGKKKKQGKKKSKFGKYDPLDSSVREM
jgi:hypothetical protein